MGRIEELEKYAKEYDIPIIQKDGIEFLKKYIIDNNIKTILEIGTAIGYSAIMMASVDKNIKITTVERDEERYKQAEKNIELFGLKNQIKTIFDDALNIDIKDKYDLIFIDAAKAQSIKFFEKYKYNLNEDGTIITDNMNFHGLTKDPDKIESKNLRALVKKINRYRDYLKDNKDFNTIFIDTGDGISITKKNKGEM